MEDNTRTGLNGGAKPFTPGGNQHQQQFRDPVGFDGGDQAMYHQQQPYLPRGRGRAPGGNPNYGYNNNHAMYPPQNYYQGGGMQEMRHMHPHMGRGSGHGGGPQQQMGSMGGAPGYGNGPHGVPPMNHPQQRHPRGQQYGPNPQQYGGMPPQQQQPHAGAYPPQHQQQQHPGMHMPLHQQQHQQRQMVGGGFTSDSPPRMGAGQTQTPPPGTSAYQQRNLAQQTHLPPPPNQQQLHSPIPTGMHPVQRGPPHQQPHPQQQVPPPPPPATAQQTVAQPTFMRGNVTPKVIMVTGYSRTGKTTVAKEIAKQRGYEYISLAPGKVRDSSRREEVAEEDDEEEDEEFHSLADRFAPLSELLARKSTIKGIVIDDALIFNKFEPYYVVFMLEKAGLHLDYLVIITTELDSLVKRGVRFSSNKKMKAHPESFEFGALLESHNAAANGVTPIAVVDGECDLDMVVKDSLKQLKEVEARGLPPLQLPEVNFIPNCALVSDPQLVDQVLAAERAALGLQKLLYGIPYSEPNFLMEYVQFVRHSLLFKSYQIVPWIWGDKVSLIGYGDDVYVHLPSYKVVFHLTDIPTPMREMIIQLKGEVEDAKKEEKAEPAAEGEKPRSPPPPAAAGGAAGEKQCLFSLEATMLKSVLYISDMMVLGTHKGSQMLLPSRVALMKERLGKLPETGPVRLLEHFHVREVSKCLKTYAGIARGVLFVNPDGMAVGSYESRNFIYPSEDVKSVKIRIWGGRVESDGMWVFDALASDSGKDTPIINADGTTTLVYISNDDVDQFSVNDGDIVECIEEQHSPVAAQQKGGKKAAKGQPASTHLAFQRRCEWQVDPTTLYYQSAFLSKPAWPTNLFLEACCSIRYDAPVAPSRN